MMEGLDRLDVISQFIPDRFREDGGAVLGSLSSSDKDEILAEVHVLDAEADAFEEPEARPVEQSGHQGMAAFHRREESRDLFSCEDGGRPGVPFGACRGDCILERPVQNVPVQKDDGVEGLALRGGGDLPLGGEVGQKSFDVLGLELVGMGLAAGEPDIAENSLAVGLFGAVGVVMVSEDLPHLVHEPEFWVWCESGSFFHNDPHNIRISGKLEAER